MPSLAHEGRRSFLDVHQQLAQNKVFPATKDLLFYQQFPTSTGFPTTTDAAQLATYAASIQAQQATAAQAAIAAQQAAAQQAAAAAATPGPTTVAPTLPAATAAPAAAAPPMIAAAAPGMMPGAAPVTAPVAPAKTSVDAAAMGGMTMPDIDAKDLLPMTAETDPDAAERMMAAAKANAAPAGPEAAVIAEWAERFGKYSMDATVAAMRNVVGQIAREKAEEVISNVFASKYPGLHVTGVLPPMPYPGPAPGPAPSLAPAPPGPAMR